MNARRAGIAVLSSAVLAVALLTPAGAADDPRDRKREIDAAVAVLRDKVSSSAEAVDAAGRLLADADARLPGARSALESARGDLAGAQAHEIEVAARLAETIARAEATAAEHERVKVELQGHRDAVGAMARQAYIGGDYTKLTIAMNAKSPDDFTSALAYLRAVNRSERTILAALDDERATLVALAVAVEQARLQVIAEQDAALAAVADRQAKEAQAAAAAEEVEALVAARAAALEVAEDQRDAVTEQYRQMQAESDRLARIIAERAAAARRAAEAARKRAEKVVESTGVLLRPVDGPITSSYGMRYHPILHVHKVHTGIDFGVPVGTKVRSALGGTVLQSYYNSAYGNRVTVDHGLVKGVYLVTTYNHLSRSAVRPGSKLDRGEVLGYSGNTGWSTGPHLHFETLEDGRFVDPMKWLK